MQREAPGGFAAELMESWQAYLAEESRGVRRVALARLHDFIGGLKNLPEADQDAWAFHIAASVFDRGEAVPLRAPLVQGVLLPAWVRGFHQRVPGAARWLGGLMTHVSWAPGWQEGVPVDDWRDVSWFQRALAQDPGDDLSRQRLIEALARDFRHALHELPSGVLFGMDGATIEQCQILADELRQFEMLVRGTEGEDRFRSLIANARLHFSAYPDYLLRVHAFRGYGDYLDQLERG